MTTLQKSRESLTSSSYFDSECEICHGAGYTLVEHDAYWYYSQLPKYSGNDKYLETLKGYPLQPFAIPCPKCNGGSARAEAKKRKAGLPEVMQTATMADFDWSLYKDSEGKLIDTGKKQQLTTLFVTQFPTWRDKGMGLYICSKMRGSGKTFLASAICNELMTEKYVDVRFIATEDLIPIDSGDYKDQRITTQTLIESELLVLDDLGQKNNGKGWTEDILYEVIDDRMSALRPTIITSNYKIGELNYDSRIIDRLNKTTVTIELPEVSIRTVKAAEEKEGLFKAIGFA